MSAACTSARSTAAARAAPIAPAPQHRSTITTPGQAMPSPGRGDLEGRGALPKGGPREWVPPKGGPGGWVPPGETETGAAGGPGGSSPLINRVACRTRNSVRRRGTNTPGATVIRRPQNSAQPRTCSSGRPATRRSTIASSSSGVRAVDMSRRASSSAKTQPAARSLLMMTASETDISRRNPGARLPRRVIRPEPRLSPLGGLPARCLVGGLPRRFGDLLVGVIPADHRQDASRVRMRYPRHHLERRRFPTGGDGFTESLRERRGFVLDFVVDVIPAIHYERVGEDPGQVIVGKLQSGRHGGRRVAVTSSRQCGQGGLCVPAQLHLAEHLAPCRFGGSAEL